MLELYWYATEHQKFLRPILKEIKVYSDNINLAAMPRMHQRTQDVSEKGKQCSHPAHSRFSVVIY